MKIAVFTVIAGFEVSAPAIGHDTELALSTSHPHKPCSQNPFLCYPPFSFSVFQVDVLHIHFLVGGC
jgi:hypothetical protein